VRRGGRQQGLHTWREAGRRLGQRIVGEVSQKRGLVCQYRVEVYVARIEKDHNVYRNTQIQIDHSQINPCTLSKPAYTRR
jgi:hypothetical protein